MLVLTRKIGQQVIIPGCQVTIDVLNVGKNRVSLGIVAPSTTPVYRSEVCQRVHSEGGIMPKPSSQ
jgi:carbon storage regulator CsrA